MNLLEGLSVNGDWLACFALLSARLGGWIWMIPLLGAKSIAGFARVALTLGLAVALVPIALQDTSSIPQGTTPFIAALIGEFVLGLVVGWVCGLLFHAAEMAGGLADFTSGMAFASTVDPNSGTNSAAFARFFSITFIAIAFASDAHHVLIGAFAGTINSIPVGEFPVLESDTIDQLTAAIGSLMRAALEIAAPMLGALFLTEMALGLVSKFYPQANILMVGLSVKALVALATAGLVLVMLPPKVGPLLEGGIATLWAVI